MAEYRHAYLWKELAWKLWGVQFFFFLFFGRGCRHACVEINGQGIAEEHAIALPSSSIYCAAEMFMQLRD